jgi:hypothetical protein
MEDHRWCGSVFVERAACGGPNVHVCLLVADLMLFAENLAMAETEASLHQFIAFLKLSDEQKQTAETLLAVVHQINRLEAEIKAMPEPQRDALMRYWTQPFLRSGSEVACYERSFAELVEVLRSSFPHA